MGLKDKAVPVQAAAACSLRLIIAAEVITTRNHTYIHRYIHTFIHTSFCLVSFAAHAKLRTCMRT